MKLSKKQKLVAAGIAAVVVIGGGAIAANAAGGTGCATLTYPLCARSVAKTQVVDNSLDGVEIKDGSLGSRDLDSTVNGKLNDKSGRLSKIESDGPYPGSTDLSKWPGQGANSTAVVPNDGKSHTVWVQCAQGKVALGGGFRLAADAGDAAAKAVQVIASEPTQIKAGKVVYEPIAGDPAGSILANGWLVEAINTGTADVTVRPWVTCAQVG
ncbi:hypothetical protein [Kribbella swartbergensis]